MPAVCDPKVPVTSVTGASRRELALLGLDRSDCSAADTALGLSVWTLTLTMTEAGEMVTATSATLTPKLVATFCAIDAFFASV
jgi:hypothetical protein